MSHSPMTGAATSSSGARSRNRDRAWSDIVSTCGLSRRAAPTRSPATSRHRSPTRAATPPNSTYNTTHGGLSTRDRAGPDNRSGPAADALYLFQPLGAERRTRLPADRAPLCRTPASCAGQADEVADRRPPTTQDNRRLTSVTARPATARQLHQSPTPMTLSGRPPTVDGPLSGRRRHDPLPLRSRAAVIGNGRARPGRRRRAQASRAAENL